MRRGGGHFIFTPGLPAWAWAIIAVVAVALVIVLAILFIRRRQTVKARSEVLTERQRGILENFEAQVLALLSQHGGRLSQVQIATSLGLPSDKVAEKLLEMECDGLIERTWTVDEYTFSVKRKGA